MEFYRPYLRMMNISMARITKSSITTSLRKMERRSLGKSGSTTAVFIRLMTVIRFERVDPTVFRVGDIVEVQTTLVAVPIKNGRFKMLKQLRSIALLDSTFTEVRSSTHIRETAILSTKTTQDATVNRAKAIVNTPPVLRPTIKRRIGYDNSDDDVSDTRRRFVNMGMNDKE